MADDTYTSNRRLNSGASEFNAIAFLVENMIKGLVNTALPVRVDSVTVNSRAGALGAKGTVEPAGYVSATPLVMQRGADGKSLQPVSIPQLPFFRYRAGKAALVMDPQPGDVGIAVFAQQDIGNMQQEGTDPVPAGSFRCYDMSDGCYLGGLLGPAPTTWVIISPTDGKIEVNAPQEVVVRSENASIGLEAKEEIVLKSKNIRMEAENGVSTTAGAGVTTEAPQVSTTSPDIALNGPVSAYDVSGGSGGRMTVNGSMLAKGALDSETSMTAPNFYGTLHGDVDGYCRGAH